jgi:hypothetical protein
MIDPLKIILCTLKSVKQPPGVQNDSPRTNKTGSLDYPVLNTPGSRLNAVFTVGQSSEQVYNSSNFRKKI